MKRLLFPGLVLALSFLLYGQSLRHPVMWDDATMLTENPAIQSLERVPEYFWNPQTFSRSPEGAMYRPVLQATFALDRALWDETHQATGYHLTSILLHALAALLAGGLIIALGARPWAARTAALLFSSTH